MASYNDTVLTNSGIAILNRVLAGKCTVTFTRAVSSIADYSGKTLSELQALTSLDSIEQNGVATRFDVQSKTMVSIDLLFTNEDLKNSYEIKTIGLYAKASDSSTEVLYAIATASDPETMPAYVDQKLAKFTLTLYTKVGQADKTSITITDEGVVKSINGSLTPDVNGNVTIDDSSHAKFIEAELINGHLLVPLVDDRGNPITDPDGNQLVADEYLPKSIKIGDHKAIYPGTDNTVKLPVYTQAEIDAKLSAKADFFQNESEHSALQTQITGNTNHLGDVDDALGKHTKQITDNANHLASVDDTLSQHTKQIGQATGEASYALDQIGAGQAVVALSDGQGGYLTDESGNPLVSEIRVVTSVNGKTPGADGNVTIDDYYPKQAIDNRLEAKADLMQMEDEHKVLQRQITGNANHLDTVDDTLSRHDKQIGSLDSKMPQAAYVPVTLEEKTDLNTVKTCGFFMIRSEAINSPVSGWVYVKVLGTPDRLTQFAWQDIVPSDQWCRWYDGRNWYPWVHYTKAI